MQLKTFWPEGLMTIYNGCHATWVFWANGVNNVCMMSYPSHWLSLSPSRNAWQYRYNTCQNSKWCMHLALYFINKLLKGFVSKFSKKCTHFLSKIGNKRTTHFNILLIYHFCFISIIFVLFLCLLWVIWLENLTELLSNALSEAVFTLVLADK